MRATRTIPIVFQATADPVGTGLVASLGRPGGNVTGLTLQSTELARKRLQLMREAVPGAARIGVLTLRDPDAQLAAARLAGNLMLAETQAAAQQMAVALVDVMARRLHVHLRSWHVDEKLARSVAEVMAPRLGWSPVRIDEEVRRTWRRCHDRAFVKGETLTLRRIRLSRRSELRPSRPVLP